jgi:uncharacterized membrane protein HdeD (DUF308 family)
MTGVAPSSHAAVRGTSETRSIGGGWSIALGVLMLVAGMLASLTLITTTYFTILYIAAMMIVAGVSQFVLAFTLKNARATALWAVGGLFYTIAGILAVTDPLLAGAGFSLAVGALVTIAGVTRIASAFGERKGARRLGDILAGTVTLIVGIAILATWPIISLWLLGAILSADLIVQGMAGIVAGIGPMRGAQPIRAPRLD